MAGFRSQYVFVLFDDKGEISCIAKKRDNAERQIPEGKRNVKRQCDNRIDWAYGRHDPWTLRQIKLLDGDDLFAQDGF